MEYNTSELCDLYADTVDVVEPLFSNFGGISSFGGEITTIKCFESCGLIRQVVKEPGEGRVLLIDGGGSLRRALIDIDIAETAMENGWEGLIVFGCVRDVDALDDLDIGIQAMASIPVGGSDDDIGDKDIPVNFASVSFLPEDHVYADNTGII